jgi:hypothetical protein
MARFQLARVAQPVAVATGKHGLDDVQPDDPAPAVPAHWNHGRLPPNLQGVQTVVICCSRPSQLAVKV